MLCFSYNFSFIHLFCYASEFGVELSHKKLQGLRFIDQTRISVSKNEREISASCKTGNKNVEVCAANIFKNYMREAATEICGNRKREKEKG